MNTDDGTTQAVLVRAGPQYSFTAEKLRRGGRVLLYVEHPDAGTCGRGPYCVGWYSPPTRADYDALIARAVASGATRTDKADMED